MKKVIILLNTLVAFLVNSQNLVPNPSFEEYTTCPDNISQVYKVIGWQSYRSTPDYYNKCNNFGVVNMELIGVPKNFYGFQYASDGEAYCGLVSWGGGEAVREFIGCELLTPLDSGINYFVSMKLNFPYRNGNPCYNTVIKNMGIRFSNIQYTESSPHPVDNNCDICADEFIFDTLNWVQVKGTFTPTQAYKYLVIGNFFTDASTETMTLFPALGCGDCSAYYVDNIVVTTDSLYGDIIENFDILEMPNIFSPNSDGINDEFKPILQKNIEIKGVTIINRWGSVLFNSESSDFKWDGKYLNKNCSEGLYIWKVIYSSQNGIENVQSGFVELIR